MCVCISSNHACIWNQKLKKKEKRNNNNNSSKFAAQLKTLKTSQCVCVFIRIQINVHTYKHTYIYTCTCIRFHVLCEWVRCFCVEPKCICRLCSRLSNNVNFIYDYNILKKTLLNCTDNKTTSTTSATTTTTRSRSIDSHCAQAGVSTTSPTTKLTRSGSFAYRSHYNNNPATTTTTTIFTTTSSYSYFHCALPLVWFVVQHWLTSQIKSNQISLSHLLSKVFASN